MNDFYSAGQEWLGAPGTGSSRNVNSDHTCLDAEERMFNHHVAFIGEPVAGNAGTVGGDAETLLANPAPVGRWKFKRRVRCRDQFKVPPESGGIYVASRSRRNESQRDTIGFSLPDRSW